LLSCQQLEIVRLLALGVKTLILDEPTTGISGEQKAILFNTLKYLANEEGMIVLFVSHKLEDVVELCHRVAVLREGRVIGERAMPVTTHELVQMMFGDVLKPQTRAQLDLTKSPSVITTDRRNPYRQTLRDAQYQSGVASWRGYRFRWLRRKRAIIGVARASGARANSGWACSR
jgi:simple sugar transport system ATP-binding protein